jgi:rhomboid protease GluP
MPEHNQTIIAEGYEASSLLALAYGSLQQLNWTIKYANENILVGYTPRSWKRYDNEITIETTDNQLTVSSKMIHGEAFDLAKRTKKDVNEFAAAFEICKQKATAAETELWSQHIQDLKTNTIKMAEEEVKEAVEIDKVMNLSKGGLQVTYGLIAINVVLFVLMVAGGADFLSPKPWHVLKWGASFPPMDLNGDWWRAFTCMFLHFGILHLVLNMYALYSISIFLEPMLGKLRYIAAYVCSGLIASAISIVWRQDEMIVGAGASGAIFGMYGVFLSLMLVNLIPKKIKQAMMQSVLVFVAYNVFYGFKPGSGIDNAAHIGGLVSGMLIGFVFSLTFKNPTAKKIGMITGLVVIATIVTLFTVFKNTSTTPLKVDYKTGEIYSLE